MVGIVSENGLGLFNASSNVLGNAGLFGQGWLSQPGMRGYVNAATGNLILQAQDEVLSGRGADVIGLRTYNSLGTLTSDFNGDRWLWGGQSFVKFNAAADQQGKSGTVTRVDADGHSTNYVWDSTKGVYTYAANSNHEGAGADDFVKFDATLNQWVWVEGSSRREEHYDPSSNNSIGMIKSQKDSSGNQIDYNFTGSVLTITDHGSGQQIKLTYAVVPGTSLTRLLKMETFELTTDGAGRPTSTLGSALKQVDYGYDTSGRLVSVTTDLTPNDATDNGNNAKLFKTLYLYDGTSFRITGILQGDGSLTATSNIGSRVDISYYQSGANAGKVLRVTDASGVQTFTYNSSSTDVQISDSVDNAGNPSGNVRNWTYTYDANQQLTKVDSPSPQSGGSRLTTQFFYDASGNVTKIIDAAGRAVIYQYDPNGNRILERDALGNTLSRTFDSNNQVTSETHYTKPDSAGLDETTQGIGNASGALTIRYIYESNPPAGQTPKVRFVVSAEGRVSESRYGTGTNDNGLLVQSRSYTAAQYTGTTFTEAALAAFVSGLSDKSQVEITQLSYDLRGNLSNRTDFAAADSSGAGILNATAAGKAATVTDYIYGAHGELLQTIAQRGAGRSAGNSATGVTLTSFSYDGMGRQLTRIAGGDSATQQTTAYDDKNNAITITNAAGLTTVRSFNTLGELTSVSQSGNATGAAGGPTQTRSTQYFYDLQGRLTLTRDALGHRQFSFYDNAGRVAFSVDTNGAVCGYGYDASGKVTTQICYATPVSQATMDGWLDNASNPTKVTKLTLVAGTDFTVNASKDRSIAYHYDASGRLDTQTDAAGTATSTRYDGDSRITAVQTGDRVTRYFYNRDGLQIGVVDPLGFLTERKYNFAGRLIETIRYATRSAPMSDVSAPLWIGLTNQTAVGGHAFSYALHATDVDGDRLTYSLVSVTPSTPAWITLDTSVPDAPVLRGTPPSTLTSYDVVVQASDSRGRTTNATVRVTVGNSPPSWATLSDVTLPDTTTTVNVVLPAASDNEGGTLTYSIDPALLSAAGLQFNASTRTISRISGANLTPGTYAVTARVTDSGGLFTERSFLVQIANQGPTWNVTGPLTAGNATRGASFTYTPPLPTDFEGQALTYRVISAPAWLTLANSSSPQLTGTPPTSSPVGSQVVILEAQDTFGETVRLAFALNVVNQPPTWGSGALPDYVIPAGQSINYTPPQAVDPEGKAITYSVIGQAPPNMTINPVTGQISGPTSSNDLRSYQVVLRATDADGGSVDRSLTIQLLNYAPVYDGSLPQEFDLGAASVPFVIHTAHAFTDPNGEALTYTVSFASAGWTGLAMSANGDLSVTPPVNTFKTTQKIATIIVRDPHGAQTSVDITFNLLSTVPAPPGPPPLAKIAPPRGAAVAEIAPPPAPVLEESPPVAAIDAPPAPDKPGRIIQQAIVVPPGPPPGGDPPPPALDITSPGSVTVNEGPTAGFFYQATADQNSVTWHISGGDSALFSCGLSGGISFLQSAQPNADYDTRHSYSFTLAGTRFGSTVTTTVTVFINNLPPTLAGVPSALTFSEGTSPSADLFPLSAADPAGGAVTYSLVNLPGSTDANALQIVDVGGVKKVRFIAAPDFDTKQSYTFKVRATDAAGAFSEQTVTLSIANIAPTLSIAPGTTITVNEGTSPSTDLLTPSFADPGGGTVTLSLVNLSGSTDANAFQIVGGKVRFIAAPDFDTKTSYSFKVRATDAAGAFTEQTVTIAIANVAPTLSGVPSSAITFNEGTSPSTDLFTPSASDPAGGAVTYSLVNLSGSTDANAFQIVDVGGVKKVRFIATPDFDTKQSYTFKVRVTDAAGVFTEQTVTVNVGNVAPTIAGVPTSAITFNEGTSTSTDLFTPSGTDPAGGVVTFSLVNLSGKTDANAFQIVGGKVRFATVPDFETQQSYTFKVRATDSGGLFTEQTVTINIADVSPAISGGASASVVEGTSLTTAVYDPKATGITGGALTYTLEGNDAAFFTIDSTGKVFLKAVANYETRQSYAFTVRVTDGGETATQAVTLTVTDVAPAISGAATVSVAEDSAGVIYAPTITDPAGGPLTLTLEGPDAAFFTLDPITGEVRFAVSPDFETRSTYSFSIRVSDGTLSAVRPVTVTVSDIAADDDLATWRPASTDALHSYRYYDMTGRLVGSLDERGFLSETLYNEQDNNQQTITYLNHVSATSSSTLSDLRTAALAGSAETGTSTVKSETRTVQYDALGRVSLTTGVDGTLTHFYYDAAGRLVRTVVAEGQQETDGANAQRGSRTRFNAFDEVTGTLGGVGDATLTGTVTQAQIDTAIATYGMRFDYDAAGRKIKATDANGHITRYYYDTFDANGRQRLLTLDAAGEVSEIFDNAFGQVSTTRQYGTRVGSALLADLLSGAKGVADLLTALSSMPSEKNTKTDYDYEQRGLVKSITTKVRGKDDPADATNPAVSFTVTNNYTVYGQLQASVRTILKSVTGDANTTTTARYDYDLDGQLISTTGDVGGINFNTRQMYDAFGRVATSIDAAGNLTTTDYHDGTDNSGRVIVLTDPLGRAMRTRYDALSRVLEVTDAIQMAITDDTQRKKTLYSYDDVNRSITVTTAEGVRVKTLRTRSGEALAVIDGRQMLADQSKYTTHDAYDADGRLLTVIDALHQNVTNQFALQNGYDNSGRLTSTTDARGTVTTYGYDEVNRIVTRVVDPTIKDNQGNVTHSGLDLTTQFEFDALGEQVTVREGKGNLQGANLLHVTGYRYDLAGRRIQAINDPDRDDNHDGIIDYTGLKLATTYTYDDLGNTVQLSQGTVANPDQQVTQYVFDQLGRLVKQILAPSKKLDGTPLFGAGSASVRDLTKEYRYDLAGRVTRSIDEGGNSTWSVYDNAGQLIQTIDALGEVGQNDYDLDGRLSRTIRYHNPVSVPVTDSVAPQSPGRTSADQVSYFIYNNDGRQLYTLQAVVSGVWSISQNIRDANGNLIETRKYDQFLTDDRIAAIDAGGLGVISASSMQSELTRLKYDESQPATLAAVRRTHFAYDKNNQLRFTVDAMGGVTETVYDPSGHALTTTAFADIPTLSAYDEAAINGAVNRGNAANRLTQFAYDNAGRVKFIARELSAGQGTTPGKWLVNEQVYDALSRVVQTIGYDTALSDVIGGVAINLNSAAAVAGALQASDKDRISGSVYDQAGLLAYTAAAQTVTAARTGMKYIVTHNAYDASGHVIQSTAYAQTPTLADLNLATLDAAVINNSTVANDARNRTTRFIFDLVGRLRFTVAADGALSESVYNSLGQVTEQRQFNVRVGTNTAITEAGLTALRGARHVGDGVTRGESYGYNAVGRKTSTTDALGFTEQYSYNSHGDLEFKTDKQGHVWQYTYDLLGRVSDELSPIVSVKWSDGTTHTGQLRTHYSYDILGNLKRRIEATDTIDQRFTDYDYDLLGRQITVTLPGVYDPDLGRVVAASSASGAFMRTTETVYNTFGNAVRSATRTGNGANDLQYSYQTYDNLGRIVHEVDALHHVTKIAYNSFGEQSAVTRNGVDIGAPTAANGLWSISDVDGKLSGDTSARMVSMAYDNLGRQIQVTQPSTSRYYVGSSAAGTSPSTVADQSQSAITKYEFSVFGDLVHQAVKIDTAGTGSANGPGTWRDTWHYFDVRGRETLTVDALGYQTARAFDALGNLTQTIEYAKAGSLATSADSAPATPTLSNPDQAGADRVTSFGYDALNHQTSITRSNLRYTAVSGSSYVENTVSRLDGVTISTLTYDELGRVATSTDALKNVTTFTYDELGRQKTITEPARVVASASVLDPFQNQVTASPVTTLTYNVFGQVVSQVRDPKGGGAATLTTTNSYDYAGNLLSTTDASGAVRNRQYDYAGHVTDETVAVSLTAADLELTGAQFEDGTNMAAYLARFNQTLERRYVYDALGRVTDTLDVYQETHWGVDSDSDQTNNTTLASKQSGTRSVYDAFGAVTDEFKVWGDASTAVSALNKAEVSKYTYDNAGKVITKRSGDGEHQYYYDLTGMLTREEQRNDPSTADGSVTRITETVYDLLSRATLERLPSFTGSVLSGASYTQTLLTPFVRQSYDRWGNVVSHGQGGYVRNDNGAVSSTERTTAYDYNQDNHVIAEHLPTQTAYVGTVAKTLNVTHVIRYDVLGRAVQEQDYADDVNTAATESIALRVAADGSTDGRRKQYDAAGHLTAQIDASGDRIDYAYDANGNRVGTKDGSGAILVDTFDANGHVLTHNLLVSGATPALKTICRYKYDQAGRMVLQAEYTNDATQAVQQYLTYTQYDERNQVRQVARAARTASGLGNLETDRAYAYDVLGNKIFDTDSDGFAFGSANFNNLAQRWSYDTADYTVGRLDNSTVGTRVTTYQYTDFGQLWKQDSGVTHRTFSYFENGLRQQIVEHQEVAIPAGTVITDKTTNDSYDSKGELVHEDYTTVFNGGASSNTGSLNTFYDDLGRITQVASPLAGSSLQFVNYGYDALGNRRFINGHYNNGDGVGVHTGWFDYDAEGRMTIVDGKQSGSVVSGEGGTTITYDAAGRRASEETALGPNHDTQRIAGDDGSGDIITRNWTDYLASFYTYDDLGYLTGIAQTRNKRNLSVTHTNPDIPGTSGGVEMGPDPVTKETRVYDTTGRLRSSTTYGDADWASSVDDTISNDGVLRTATNTYGGPKGLLQQATITDPRFRFSSSLNYFYRFVTAAADGTPISAPSSRLAFYTDDRTNLQNNLVSHASYAYTYSEEARGLEQKTITARLTDENGVASPDAVTSNYYDGLGNLVTSIVGGQQPSTTNFDYNADGQIISKSGTGIGTSGRGYYYAQGHEVAAIGFGSGTAVFDNGYTPISSAYPAATPSAYTVNVGDTLSGIAKTLWGDGSLWYLIADANNVNAGPNDALPMTEVGRTYRVPNVVTSIHNNADTFAPYNPASIIGNLTPVPQVPPPPGAGCQDVAVKIFEGVFVAAVATVLTVYGGGALAGTWLGPVLGNIIAGVAVGAASQGARVGLGLQQNFDSDQLYITGVGSALGGAVNIAESGAAGDALMNPSGEIDSVFASGGGFQNSYANILQGAAINELTSVASGRGVSEQAQGDMLYSLGGSLLANALTGGGSGSSDWASILQSVAGGAAGAANPHKDEPFSWANLVGQALNGFASGVAGYAANQSMSSDSGSDYSMSTTATSLPDYMPGSDEARAVLDQLDDLDLAQQFADDQEAIDNDERGRLFAENDKKRSFMYQKPLFGFDQSLSAPVDDHTPEVVLTGAIEDPAVQASVSDTADPEIRTSSMSADDARNQDNDAKLNSAETKRQNELNAEKTKRYLAEQAAAAAEAKAAADEKAAADAAAAAAAQEKQRLIRENRDNILNFQATRLTQHGITQHEINSTLGPDGIKLLEGFGYDPSFLRTHHMWGYDSVQDNLKAAIVSFAGSLETQTTMGPVTPQMDAIRAQVAAQDQEGETFAMGMTPGGTFAGTAAGVGRVAGETFGVHGESFSERYGDAANTFGPTLNALTAPFVNVIGSYTPGVVGAPPPESPPTPAAIPDTAIESDNTTAWRDIERIDFGRFERGMSGEVGSASDGMGNDFKVIKGTSRPAVGGKDWTIGFNGAGDINNISGTPPDGTLTRPTLPGASGPMRWVNGSFEPGLPRSPAEVADVLPPRDIGGGIIQRPNGSCLPAALAYDASAGGIPTEAVTVAHFEQGKSEVPIISEDVLVGRFGPKQNFLNAVTGQPMNNSLQPIKQYLEAAGPGARVIVGGTDQLLSSPGQSFGHVFNGVNFNGTVSFWDASTGSPPRLVSMNQFWFVRTH